MEDSALEKLKYPIGHFVKPKNLSQEKIEEYISAIKNLPGKLNAAVSGLNDAQLDTEYRPGGWTVRQLIHHIADSHLNSYIRFKWTLTENHPTIKAYDQDLWAELPEAKSGPVEVSLILLEALHKRWSLMLENLSPEEMSRSFIHPESGKSVRLDLNIALYAWHCEHHYAHIIGLKERKLWY